MSEFRLMVDSGQLLRTSGEIDDILRAIRVHAERIGDISARTQGYWQGSAGRVDREDYIACRNNILNAVKKLEARSVRLMRLAGLYQEAERKVGEEMNAIDIEPIR